MHQFLKFILILHNTLHVSDGLSVHHQQFKTVHTATVICQTGTAVCLLATGICQTGTAVCLLVTGIRQTGTATCLLATGICQIGTVV
jgi:hypothetical protein